MRICWRPKQRRKSVVRRGKRFQQNKCTDNIRKLGGKRQSEREKGRETKETSVFSKSKHSERKCEGVERDRSRKRS